MPLKFLYSLVFFVVAAASPSSWAEAPRGLVHGVVFLGADARPLSGVAVSVERGASTFSNQDGAFWLIAPVSRQVPNFDGLSEVLRLPCF